MATTKKEHAEKVDELVEHATNVTPAPAPGHNSIVHNLELAFVQALNGAKEEAEKLLAEAEAEIQKWPALAEKEFTLLKARVHAVLAKF